MHRFLSGWAFPPNLFISLLPKDTNLIDTTKLLPALLSNTELKKNWIERALEQTGIQKDDHLIGYSSGSIVALAIASIIPVKLTLFAPTLSFISRPSHPSGIAPEVLALMRKGLENSPEITLRRFYRDCQIPRDSYPKSTYTTEELIQGLWFLEHVDLTGLSIKTEDITIYHSLTDKIIPYSSGERVTKMGRSKINDLDGGHGGILQLSAQSMQDKLF